MNEARFFEAILRATVAIVGLFLLCLALKHALPIALPLLVALGLGLLISPLSERLSRQTHLPVWLWSIVLIVLLLALTALTLGFAVNRLLSELLRFSSSFGDAATGLDSFVEYLSSLSAHLPILSDIRLNTDLEAFWQTVDASASEALLEAAKRLATALSDALIRLVSSLPTALLTLTVTLLATYYFSLQKSRDELMSLLPETVQTKLRGLGRLIGTALRGWARAYLLILLITAVELYIGLSLLDVDYAFLAAFGVALIDILPILGTGTVLIPWSILGFATGDSRLGIGLLLLYAVISLVRQLIEPKLVGKSLGLSPIMSLIGFYLGFRLFGFVGMLAAPAVLMIVLPKKQEKSPTDRGR